MALPLTTIRLDTRDVIADVDQRIFGGLLEHMGRCVYEGVFDPSSRHADQFGCRSDVLDALAPLRMTAMRYPGGNFVSGYDWRDGVGPVDRRPERLERAWRCIEPNTFGTDEFLSLCERVGWIPMMAVNLGTGSPAEAAALSSYCNSPTGVEMGDWRAEHGREMPYGVDLWCLGNEMDGPWQIGRTSVEGYVGRAREAARLMREVSPGVEVVACGSSDPRLPTFPSWDRTVLTTFGDGLDYLSVHRYARNFRRNTPEFVAYGVSVDRQIDQLDSICRDAQQRSGADTLTRLSFDEWNVWYRTQVISRMLVPSRLGGKAPHLIEETFNLEDALVVANFLNSFIRHADIVRIANIAQVVNVIAPVRTRGDELLIQSIYHPFRMYSQRREGHAVRVDVAGPNYDTRKLGTVPYLDASSILGPEALHLFLVNRSSDQAAPVGVEVRGADLGGPADAECVTGPSARSKNTFRDPNVIRAKALDGITVSQSSIEATLPPLSVCAISVPFGSGSR